MAEQPKVLIIYGYHPKEIFAVEVGGYLYRDNSDADIRVVKYGGKQDRGTSLFNLLKFVENHKPLISPIVLHGDDDAGFNAAIIYSAHSRQSERRAQKPLLNFCFKNSCDGDVIAWGRFFIKNAKYGLIDVELNSGMGLERAAAFVRDLAHYLIDLRGKGIKL